MRHALILALTGLTLAAAAQAQDTTTARPGIPDSVRARVPIVDSTALKAGVSKPTVATLTAAVDVTPATVEKLRSRVSISSSDLELVSDRELGPTQADPALSQSLERNAVQLDRLRTILNGHPNVKEALYARQPGLTIGDIIAAEVKSDGKIVLYYRGR